MLKLENDAIRIGERIVLPEKWHEKLEKFSKIQNCPYEFFLVDIIKKKKEKYYICEAEKKGRCKKVRIGLTEFIVKYLFAKEVPDSNIGFSFREYLPLEESKILVTNLRNPSEVVPAILKLEVELVDVDEDGESIVTFTFKIDFINGTGFTDVRYYSDGSKKSSWKFLLHQDESYMTDYEKMFRDTVIHKSYVQRSAEKLARYLEKEKAFEYAKIIRKRAKNHDDSKMSCADEMHALSRIINDKTTMKDSSKQLSPIKKDAIALHYKHNTHHPEHFESVLDMSKEDIMEMCCDWHARSCQYGTNFLKFVQDQQENRFHFPKWMFAEILHYCEVLDSDI